MAQVARQAVLPVGRTAAENLGARSRRSIGCGGQEQAEQQDDRISLSVPAGGKRTLSASCRSNSGSIIPPQPGSPTTTVAQPPLLTPPFMSPPPEGIPAAAAATTTTTTTSSSRDDNDESSGYTEETTEYQQSDNNRQTKGIDSTTTTTTTMAASAATSEGTRANEVTNSSSSTMTKTAAAAEQSPSAAREDEQRQVEKKTSGSGAADDGAAAAGGSTTVVPPSMTELAIALNNVGVELMTPPNQNLAKALEMFSRAVTTLQSVSTASGAAAQSPAQVAKTERIGTKSRDKLAEGRKALETERAVREQQPSFLDVGPAGGEGGEGANSTNRTTRGVAVPDGWNNPGEDVETLFDLLDADDPENDVTKIVNRSRHYPQQLSSSSSMLERVEEGNDDTSPGVRKSGRGGGMKDSKRVHRTRVITSDAISFPPPTPREEPRVGNNDDDDSTTSSGSAGRRGQKKQLTAMVNLVSSVLLYNVATVKSKRGQADESKKLWELSYDVLERYERQFPSGRRHATSSSSSSSGAARVQAMVDDLDTEITVATVWNNLGHQFVTNGSSDSALMCFVSGWKLLKHCDATLKRHEQFQVDDDGAASTTSQVFTARARTKVDSCLSTTLCNMGKVHNVSKAYATATKCLCEALPHVTDVDVLTDIAVNLTWIGRAYAKKGETGHALEVYEKAWPIYGQYINIIRGWGNCGSSNSGADAGKPAASSHHGVVHLLGKPQIEDQASEAGVPRCPVVFSAMMYLLGRIHQKNGHPDNALISFRSALRLVQEAQLHRQRESLGTIDEANDGARGGQGPQDQDEDCCDDEENELLDGAVAKVMRYIAQVELELGQRDQAIQTCEKALELTRSTFASDSPQVKETEALLERAKTAPVIDMSKFGNATTSVGSQAPPPSSKVGRRPSDHQDVEGEQRRITHTGIVLDQPQQPMDAPAKRRASLGDVSFDHPDMIRSGGEPTSGLQRKANRRMSWGRKSWGSASLSNNSTEEREVFDGTQTAGAFSLSNLDNPSANGKKHKKSGAKKLSEMMKRLSMSK